MYLNHPHFVGHFSPGRWHRIMIGAVWRRRNESDGALKLLLCIILSSSQARIVDIFYYFLTSRFFPLCFFTRDLSGLV